VPVVEAAAYTVLDQRSGAVLASSNADTPLAVGSLMKLLTANTVYAAGDPVKIVTAPEGLVIDPMESIIGVIPGQQLQRDTLTRAMLVVSANDAARALAVDIAGSEAAFAELMNAQAAALGLTNTHAVNVTGLDADGQFSTANDMVRLAAYLMGNQTFQASARQQSATLNGQTIEATNDLLRTYPGADGIKTGHTTQAGWCIVASANRAGRRIIVAVLGAPTEEARNAAATSLLDWAFTQ
jgi:D-alanyl-D-alanine carboxypeptidase (penicillin-binding protein 5/6)